MTTWRGAIRTINATARRSERQATQYRRQLEKRQKEIVKMQELDHAQYQVQIYENLIDRLTTMHKDSGPVYDWMQISLEHSPIPPTRDNSSEGVAQRQLQNYRPGFFDRLFRNEQRKRAGLEEEVKVAKRIDELKFQNYTELYLKLCENHKIRIEVAREILKGNLEYYAMAIKEIDPFSEIAEIGSDVICAFKSPKAGIATIYIQDDTVIPKQEKTLLKSGKLSIKDISSGKFNELYQDYVCSVVLRVGRELFALLPLSEIVVTTKGGLLNNSTGQIDTVPLLSVLLVRPTIDKLNFDLIDPSDCMKNFKHNMGFKKSQGMSAVEELEN